MTCRRAVPMSSGDRVNIWSCSRLASVGNSRKPGPGGEKAYATNSQAVG